MASLTPYVVSVNYSSPSNVYGLASNLGDLLVGTSAGALQVLSAGSNNTILQYDSTALAGLKSTGSPSLSGSVTADGGFIAGGLSLGVSSNTIGTSSGDLTISPAGGSQLVSTEQITASLGIAAGNLFVGTAAYGATKILGYGSDLVLAGDSGFKVKLDTSTDLNGQLLFTSSGTIATSSNSNLTLSPNGTGVIVASKAISGSSASLSSTLSVTGLVTGSVGAQLANLYLGTATYGATTIYASGTLFLNTSGGSVTIQNSSLNLDTSGVISTASNTNITLSPNGTGTVVLSKALSGTSASFTGNISTPTGTISASYATITNGVSAGSLLVGGVNYSTSAGTHAIAAAANNVLISSSGAITLASASKSLVVDFDGIYISDYLNVAGTCNISGQLQAESNVIVTGNILLDDLTISATATYCSIATNTKFLTITGNSLLSITSNTSVTGTLTTSGKLTVSNGGADITGTTTITGSLVANGLTLSTTLAQKTISVSSGDITLQADNIVLTTNYPSLPTHAASKQYVDSVAQGLSVKSAVRLKTAASLPSFVAAGSKATKTLTASANGTLTIDSVLAALNDRILVDQQGTGGSPSADCGIYVVTVAGSAGTKWVLTRASDANGTSTGSVTAGMFCFVSEGSAAADRGYVLITDDPIDVDTTALSFTQFSTQGVSSAAGVLGSIQYNDGSGSFAADGSNLKYTGGVLTSNLGAFTGLMTAGWRADNLRTEYIPLGNLSSQTDLGDSVAFGLNAVAAAPRSIAIGAASEAYVSETIVTTAASLTMRTDRATSVSNLTTAGKFSSAGNWYSSGFIDASTEGSYSVSIPSGCTFFPTTIVVYVINNSGTAGTVTFGLTANSGGVVYITNGTISTTTNRTARYYTSLQSVGVTDVALSISATTAGSPSGIRYSVYGLLVENEA